MSEYFRILNRVEQEQGDSDLNAGSKPLTRTSPAAPSRIKRNRKAAVARPAAAERLAQATASTGNVAAARKSTSGVQKRIPVTRAKEPIDRESPKRESFARAFDNLRAIAAGTRLRSVVIAAASGAETVEPVVTGLAEEAHRHQLQALTATLTADEGEYVLRERFVFEPDRISDGTPPRSESRPISFHLGTSDLPSTLTDWINKAREAHDLALLHGPALGDSVDAALIARATDGLVIVVEPGVTASHDLIGAVERARSVGCNILGLVAAGARDELPSWMKQIVG